MITIVLTELMAKRNLTQFQQQRKNVEQHAEETYITWKNVVSNFVFAQFDCLLKAGK